MANCHSVQKMAQPLSAYDQYPVYTGNDLGMKWSAGQTTFKLWSPAAEEARLMLYAQGDGGTPLQVITLKKQKQGVWDTTLEGDQKGRFYTVQVRFGGKWLEETPDPYAKAVGVNGKRGMIIDLAATNPNGWNNDARPAQKQFTDIILYELQVRDFSANPNSGLRQHRQIPCFYRKRHQKQRRPNDRYRSPEGIGRHPYPPVADI